MPLEKCDYSDVRLCHPTWCARLERALTLGASSLPMDCASALLAALAPANAANPLAPRVLAVAPVKRIVPLLHMCGAHEVMKMSRAIAQGR
eukprot:1297309-Pyramimonas_sp.AAC.1